MNKNWNLPFPLDRKELALEAGATICLLGSCFSDEMKDYFEGYGFEVNANPFGTLFHPLSMAKNILYAIEGSQEVEVIQVGDVFFSWDCSGTVFAYSENDLIELVLARRENFRFSLSKSKLLILTLGSSIAYVKDGAVVANCHKQNAGLFQKEFSDVEVMTQVYEQLIAKLSAFNPHLELIMTLSPIRHVRDGLVANNRSKARLLLLVERLVDLFPEKIHYFPAYEIVLDELRDYRFFKADGFHPNSQAISYVWERFVACYIPQETQRVGAECQKIKQMMGHQFLYAQSDEARKFREKLQVNLSRFQAKYPNIKW